MASSESMEDGFRARVRRAFGALDSSASLNSLWSLTGEEVEKREWKRDKNCSHRDEGAPCSSSFGACLTKDRRNSPRKLRNFCQDDLDDLNDEDNDGGRDRLALELSDQLFKRNGQDEDEWEIKYWIGLDSTLDNEKEEDIYDKVAMGRENDDDSLYVMDAIDEASCLNSGKTLSNLLCVDFRDPRAYPLAARTIMKEGDAATQNADSWSCDQSVPSIKESCVEVCKDGCKLKSILKRKENATICKSQKRVRFDPGCKNGSEQAPDVGVMSVEASVTDDGSSLAPKISRIPDYVLNPSIYTCHSFDSSCEVEESDSEACMNFVKTMKILKPKHSGLELEDASVDFPKSVTFIPRKKVSEARAANSLLEVKQNKDGDHVQYLPRPSFTTGIAAREVQHSDENAIEGDGLETTAANTSFSFLKPGRQYRTKSSQDDPAS